MTAAFVRLDAGRAEIEIVNAGHNPAALVRPDGSVVMVNASGTPLGMLPGMSYEAERFAFPAGSRILLYTDGLTEVFHGDSEFEEEFGTERLAAAFREHPSRQADHILNFLWETLGEFSHNAPQRDDMTALVICHLRFVRAGVRHGMNEGHLVQVSLPSELGYEKVAMSTAASVAKLMGFSEDRIDDFEDGGRRGLHQCDRARQ